MQIYSDIFSINVLNCQINYQFPHGVKQSYGTDSPSSSMLSYIYTGCPRRNVPNFGRVFLRLKYTDITQNTYIQS